MPKSKTRLGDLAGIVGGPAVAERKATGKTVRTGRTPKTPRSKATPTKVGEGKMQTVYLREADLEKAIRAEYELRASRQVPGRVGLSLLVRLGLDLIADELKHDREKVVQRAARVADGD